FAAACRRVMRTVVAVAIVLLVVPWPSVGGAGNFSDVPHTRWLVHVDYAMSIDGHYDASNETKYRAESTQQSLPIRVEGDGTFLLTPLGDSFIASIIGSTRGAHMRLFTLDDDTSYNDTRDVVQRATQTVDCEQILPVEKLPFLTGQFDVKDEVVDGQLGIVGAIAGKGHCPHK